MKRNANTYFSNVPTPTLPRTRHDIGTLVNLSTHKHGRLQLLDCKFVYPGQTKSRGASILVQADTYEKYPMDQVLCDTYEFFVPLRIIDKDFEKVLGDVDAYDTNVYSFPELELDFDGNHLLTHDTILNGAGWRCPVQQLFDYDSNGHGWKPKITTTTFDKINPYALMAYYCVYNEFFRDNNVDPVIPFEDLKNSKLSLLSNLFNNLEALPVNKYHDRFTSGLLTPQKPIAGISSVTIPLGLSAPVFTSYNDNANNPGLPLRFKAYGSGTITAPGVVSLNPVNATTGQTHDGTASGLSVGNPIYPANLYADLSQASGASIDQLRLAFAIQELAEIKSSFGSRMSSYYRGVWGIQVPDYILDRPEYLGGQRFDLDMVPIFNHDNLVGEMSGQSRTLTNRYDSQKSFYEFGFWITLGCFRIMHTYSQGITNPALKFKDELDMYNRKFANLGNVGQKNYLIYNDFTSSQNDEIFNFNESWTDLRTGLSTGSGDFAPNYGDSSELYVKWSFQDIYANRPVFSASWLKEDDTNVRRTMTGRLIPYATTDYGHQYMMAYIYHDYDTLPLPAHPIPSGLTNRI